MKNINIIGSGLSGPLLATLIAQNSDVKINMFERSQDLRNSNNFSGRSINLALSKRGINALENAGLFDSNFKSELIPMFGRAIHDIHGKQSIQMYGNKKSHYINSVSRASMNKILLNAAEKTKKVTINFDMKCSELNLNKNKVIFNENKIFNFEGPIIGADGYRSKVSKAISEVKNSKLNYVDIEHSYKELTIKSKNNEYQLDPDYLHIWPRRDLMIIALPNTDKSFTCTLFMKTKDDQSFESIKNKTDLLSFFETNFIDLIDLIDNFENDFFNNPTGKLVGLKVPDWFYNDKALVIGDAAHATVPFYGQGMNAAFEDCYILSKIINENKRYDWYEIFDIFSKKRKIDADSILDLSLINYKVMRNDVLDEKFIKKQKLSFMLNEDFPNQFIPVYTMVSFTNIPYNTALIRSAIQDRILDNLLLKLNNLDDYNKHLCTDIINKELSIINED